MNVSRIYRLLRMVKMLQSGHKYTVRQLAEEFEVSRRTIFRDLNMLEPARIPYYFDSSDGGYKIGTGFFLPPVNLTLTEAPAVLMLSGRLRGTSQMPLQAEATRAAMKLESVLPPAIREHVGSIVDNINFKYRES
jgi:predicted DNA-binding transcriptional regulator YafY